MAQLVEQMTLDLSSDLDLRVQVPHWSPCWVWSLLKKKKKDSTVEWFKSSDLNKKDLEFNLNCPIWQGYDGGQVI